MPTQPIILRAAERPRVLLSAGEPDRTGTGAPRRAQVVGVRVAGGVERDAVELRERFRRRRGAGMPSGAAGVDVDVQVEVWSDVVCPWCYLGRRNLERAIASLPFAPDVDVTLRSFELDPGAPAGTTAPTVDMLATKYGMTRERAEQVQRQMEQRAAQAGLTFRMTELRSGNTRAAHRLLHLANERGVQAALAEALHRAYFTEQRDVFGTASLHAIAVGAGLDGDEVTDVLEGDRYDDAVEADEALARSFGANGVPFFVIDRRYGIEGAQPAEVIAGVLQRAHDS